MKVPPRRCQKLTARMELQTAAMLADTMGDNQCPCRSIHGALEPILCAWKMRRSKICSASVTMEPKTPWDEKATSGSVQELFEKPQNSKDHQAGEKFPSTVYSFLRRCRQNLMLGAKIDTKASGRTYKRCILFKFSRSPIQVFGFTLLPCLHGRHG